MAAVPFGIKWQLVWHGHGTSPVFVSGGRCLNCCKSGVLKQHRFIRVQSCGSQVRPGSHRAVITVSAGRRYCQRSRGESARLAFPAPGGCARVLVYGPLLRPRSPTVPNSVLEAHDVARLLTLLLPSRFSPAAAREAPAFRGLRGSRWVTRAVRGNRPISGSSVCHICKVHVATYGTTCTGPGD